MSMLPKKHKDKDQKAEYDTWFEQVYVNTYAAGGVPPWSYQDVHPKLLSWAEQRELQGQGKKAIVVGCGLGDDAEFLAKRGFEVTAFDISETAIQRCIERFPDSTVSYFKEDLFQLSSEWRQQFDLVFESRTIQALPYERHQQTIEAITNLVSEQGIVYAICFGREPHEAIGGIPWPVSRKELAHFNQLGLTEVSFEDTGLKERRIFCVTYQKTSS